MFGYIEYNNLIGMILILDKLDNNTTSHFELLHIINSNGKFLLSNNFVYNNYIFMKNIPIKLSTPIYFDLFIKPNT